MITNYLQRSIDALSAIGINFKAEEAPVLALLDRISGYDANLVTSIAATLTQAPVVNAALREKIQGMEVSSRFADIITSFDSIRTDAQQMADWMADGKLQFSERIQLTWMKVRRGSIPDRFEDIRATYLDVAKDTLTQLQLETQILDAYQDYRLAMKQAEVDAASVKKTAEAVLASKRAALTAAVTALDAPEIDPAERVRLEFARDEAQRNLQDEDKRFQIITDIADQLKTAYSAAELVFARLNQYHTVKERLYERAVSFFATNEVVLTGLAASFTTAAGLSETTNTINDMSEVLNAGIEAQATTGGKVLDEALKAGYGSNMKVSSVKALADAVVEFQTQSHNMIYELRTQARDTAAEIQAITDDSKRRYAALLQKAV